MGLPAANPDGYVTASVSNVSGFHHADFLLAHGSGDDNVHYANSAHLLDMFTRERVRGYRFRMFTDRCVLPFHTPSLAIPEQGGGRGGWRRADGLHPATTASTRAARTASCTSS